MTDVSPDQTTKLLLSSTDAQVWAKEWCRIAKEIEAAEDSRELIDEGWMVGWFANAIMKGYDWGWSSKPSFYDDVKKFHEAFGLRIGDRPELPPDSMGLEDEKLRIRLIKEEFFELIEAHFDENIVAVADAIADLIYVACGMAVSYGIPLNEVWETVQKSNMDKICKDCGKPHYREDGKVAKPQGWQPPNIRKAVFPNA